MKQTRKLLGYSTHVLLLFVLKGDFVLLHLEDRLAQTGLSLYRLFKLEMDPPPYLHKCLILANKKPLSLSIGLSKLYANSAHILPYATPKLRNAWTGNPLPMILSRDTLSKWESSLDSNIWLASNTM